jgi:hypothetical protein
MTPSCFPLDLFLYFSLFSHREGGGGIEGYRVGGCRLRRSYQASFIDLWCNSRGGEAVGLCNVVKIYSRNDFTCQASYMSLD